MKENILITGCAGFIGSHAVDKFISSGYSVSGVDCMTYAAKMCNLKDSIASKFFSFYSDDIVNTDKMIEICNKENINTIINFAAETHVDNSIKSCSRFIHSNIEGVRSLLDTCRESGSSLFHVSTDEVYGSIREGSFSEDDVMSPKNPYSATKAASEHLIHAYHNTYGIDYVIVRPANNFGPRQHSEKLIPTILNSVIAGNKIPVYGDGKNVRDWLFVKDTASAIFKIFNSNILNETFNITPDNEMENIEIISRILKILDLDPDKSVEFIRDRLGHDFRYSICGEKLSTLYSEFSNFEDSLRETVDFYTREINENNV